LIFITGATGFIGKSIQGFLKKKKYQVLSLDLRKDFSELNYALNSPGDNVLIHTAWAGVLGKDRNNRIQDENLNLSHKVLNFINTFNVKKLIAFGSQAEYGPYEIRVSEDQPLKPSSYYGKIKIECFEIFKKFFSSNKDKDFIWLRLYDPYGPGDNPNWFIPYIIKNALLDESPLLTECSQIWDYLYVDDLCMCLEKIINAEYFVNGKNSNIYNLSSDNPILLKNIVKMIFHEINPARAKPLFGKVPFRKDQQFYLHGNNTKISEDFSWSPIVKIDKGLLETIKYFKALM